ncbi:hypothetical protein B0O99DRAFT_682213 [Bisporella sp. PMI_857]|nr:hypothetical protein B0O99DRAFT_590695 [Bisporella sp. PMI_857]KAH8600525.1 hypothetical protein B0O99DRAFT_682213 [Bisporella sp. PMI_857]
MIDQEVLDRIAQLPASDPPSYSREKWYRLANIVTRFDPELSDIAGTNWLRCGIPKLGGFWLSALDMEIDQFWRARQEGWNCQICGKEVTTPGTFPAGAKMERQLLELELYLICLSLRLGMKI